MSDRDFFSDYPPRARAADLDALDGISHGFFGREGGVSTGLYASLNCGLGSNDDPAAVIENRARVTRAIGVDPDRLVTVYQVHSADVVTVTGPIATDDRPKADAMVTHTAGLALAILTADCCPVLFADGEARVIGAAHAGWAGAFAGVLEATVDAMESFGAQRERIVAALGPTITQDQYEVGPEFHERFVSHDPQTADLFRPGARDHHWHFDLPAYAARRLTAAGTGTVVCLGQCTYTDEAGYYSFRRATHRKDPDYGRQLSAIALDI